MITKIIKIIIMLVIVIMIISSTIIKQYLTVLLRGSLGEIGHDNNHEKHDNNHEKHENNRSCCKP